MTYEFLLPAEIDLKEVTFDVGGHQRTYPIEALMRARYEAMVMQWSRMSDRAIVERIERALYREKREAAKRAEALQREQDRQERLLEKERYRYGRPTGATWVDFVPPRGCEIEFGRPPINIEVGGVELDPRIGYVPEARMVDAKRILNKARKFALRESLPENYAAYITFKNEESLILKAFLCVWPKDGDVITASARHIDTRHNASEVARSSHAAAPGVRARNTPSEALLAEAEAVAVRKEAQGVERLAEQPSEPAEPPAKRFTDDQGRIQAPHVDPHSAEYRAMKAKKAEWVRQMVALAPEERKQHADVAGAFDAHHEFLTTYTHNFVGDESVIAQRVKELHGLKPGDHNYAYYCNIERKNAQTYAEMDYFYGLLELEDDLERHQLLAQGRTPLVLPKDVQREKNNRLHGGAGNVHIPFTL